jgi:hypothetical protein
MMRGSQPRDERLSGNGIGIEIDKKSSAFKIMLTVEVSGQYITLGQDGWRDMYLTTRVCSQSVD